MSKFRWILAFIWTFPISLSGILNRKERLQSWEGHPVYTYRVWARGYATAHWPTILVGSVHSRANHKLMRHEERHLDQQLRWGGIVFLVSYGVMWLALYLWYWNREKAYRGVWWEVDARRAAKESWNVQDGR